MIRLVAIALASVVSDTALAQTITHRSEFVDAGNGIVEWHIYIQNNGRAQVCCFVDMEAPRFSFGNRQWVRDSRALCAYPGRENYTGLRGVTTQIGETTTFGPPIQGFGGSIVAGRIGEAKFTIRDCSEQ